jgi:hypothetical protein
LRTLASQPAQPQRTATKPLGFDHAFFDLHFYKMTPPCVLANDYQADACTRQLLHSYGMALLEQKLTVQASQTSQLQHTQVRHGCLHIIHLQLEGPAHQASRVTQVQHLQVREGRAAKLHHELA